ncbi:MAG TPA: gliding motility-associated C-terminal domain-containing protein [Chryseosolibacter sp.]|nr:gliding motility-associated C-terminal domain-containing protein [Chryseosolibacter sp.]
MKPSLLSKTCLIVVLSLVLTSNLFATHLRAGQITAIRKNCNSLTFIIFVRIYTNTDNTDVKVGGEDDILDFGDGSDPDGDGRPGILIDEIANSTLPGLPPGVGYVAFQWEHTYPANSTYVISYSEPNRNEGVVNMDGSVETRFYIETQITLDPYFGCNLNTPVLQVHPIDIGCTGVAWTHNPGAFDLDGDSLSYELLVPFRGRNATVINYRDPNAPEFYENYSTGNEAGTGPPTFNINPADGTLTWDAPGMAGEYNVAFLIREWRYIDGEWVSIGYVRRDMQIIVEECENKRPDLIVPEDICVVAGEIINETIFGIDPENQSVRIEAFSEIFDLLEPAGQAEYSPDPPVYQMSSPPAELQFAWQTECLHVRAQPYQVVFKITDDAATGPDLVTFKTWFIKVVGPKPEFADVNPIAHAANNSVSLRWDEYVCDNAQFMQVWRRVDSLAFEPDTCQTGMPPNLGYTMIAELPIDQVNHTDTNDGMGLAAGAVYCYRLVATFPLPRGGESLVSEEVCIDMLSDEPVITKVSVVKTHSTDGEVRIEWVEPYEADAILFPPPYSYRVMRAEGFTGDINLTDVVTSTSLTERTDIGLNTQDKIYNYRVIAFDAQDDVIDTSTVASTVRLEAQSQLNSIQLTWRAEVPWSNQIGLPHVIYRQEQGEGDVFTDPVQLDELVQVDVTGQGFTFVDDGPLEGGQMYCYAVETFGSYGNDDPLIAARDPLRNFSQIVCTQPGDSVPPCKPLTPIAVNALDCNDVQQLSCDINLFENIFKWNRPETDCGTDIAYYKIYFSRYNDGKFDELRDQNNDPIQVRDTFYVHRNNLTSYAGCYKIAAVDRSGNIGEISDPVCFDNCPYYELPNVFTPNRDGCNEKFSAYGNSDSGGEAPTPGECAADPDQTALKCARFVRDVEFRVFNRWGKEVFEYESELGNENRSIYIDWDGRASDGSDLSSGVYFYTAIVTFETSNPQVAKQTFKGWVHLIR